MKSKEIIRYRRMRPADLLASWRLVMRSHNHLRRQVGRKGIKYRISAAAPIVEHYLKSDPEGAYVACNEGGRILGMVLAIVRSNEWFLAFLYVLPCRQNLGIGKKLLKKAMAYGEKNKCSRFALCTYSYNEQAVAVYSKFQIAPQRAILALYRALPKSGKWKPIKSETILSSKLVTDERMLNKLGKLDYRARKILRPEEHFYWLHQPGNKIFCFHQGKRLVGYGVIHSGCQIGPIVANSPDFLKPIAIALLNLPPEPKQTGQMLFVCGDSQQLVTMLLAEQFQIMEINLLLATADVINSSLYLPGHLSHF